MRKGDEKRLIDAVASLAAINDHAFALLREILDGEDDYLRTLYANPTFFELRRDWSNRASKLEAQGSHVKRTL